MFRLLFAIMIAGMCGVCFFADAAAVEAPQAGDGTLTVTPQRVVLRGAGARQQLLVMAKDGEAGRQVDLSSVARFRALTPDIVRVDAHGVARPVGDGAGGIEVRVGERLVRVDVEVESAMRMQAVSFTNDIVPLLASAGCSVGECHGKQNGRNGFALSLLGFDPDFDYAALAMEGRGRRVFPASPDHSLIMLKATATLPHGGGERWTRDSHGYQLMRRWIADGMPRHVPNEPTLTGITVTPTRRYMRPSESQQLLVTASYSDGTQRDVTHVTAFQSNEAAIVAVDDAGRITAGPIPGEASIMARYAGRIVTCDVAIPLPGDVPGELYENLPRHNFIDELVWRKLQSLGITPSGPIDDAKYLRRVTIDIIGRLPTADEVRAFLADSTASHDKRRRVVDDLLNRPAYADHWANKWADLLRPNPYRVGIKAVINYDDWIRQQFREDRPYDAFVRDLITASGSTWRNGATVLFRDRRSPDELATIVSQLFLGIRLECAKCHQHPFEKWGQDDFYGFAAYFSQIGRKGKGLSPPISGSEEMVYPSGKGEVTHPRTGEVVEPRALDGSTPAIESSGDPRRAIAEWMITNASGEPSSDHFAMVAVNRVWADLMGRGLVEPVDDLRATNPPTNAPLLEALAADFRASGFDHKHLIRTIVTSAAYGLSSEPTPRNVTDTRNYSRHYRQRLRAEVLAGAIADITGVPNDYEATPPGTRATQVWTHRIDSVFLDTFGRPDANQDPPCYRIDESTVTQALHLMNGPQVYQKIVSDNGIATQLAKSKRPPEEIVEELYLRVYNRMPEPGEVRYAASLYDAKGADRRGVTQNLLWALLNTPEFLFKD